MQPPTIPGRGALVRDLLIFTLKLWLDGLKDVVLVPLSVGAAAVDFVFRTRLFYAILGAGERFDLWLNLFGAVERARNSEDGLFAGSDPGDDTLLAEIERLHAADAPAPGVGDAVGVGAR